MKWEFALFVIAAAFAASFVVAIAGMMLVPVVDGVCKNLIRSLEIGGRRL